MIPTGNMYIQGVVWKYVPTKTKDETHKHCLSSFQGGSARRQDQHSPSQHGEPDHRYFRQALGKEFVSEVSKIIDEVVIGNEQKTTKGVKE